MEPASSQCGQLRAGRPGPVSGSFFSRVIPGHGCFPFQSFHYATVVSIQFCACGIYFGDLFTTYFYFSTSTWIYSYLIKFSFPVHFPVLASAHSKYSSQSTGNCLSLVFRHLQSEIADLFLEITIRLIRVKSQESVSNWLIKLASV